MNERVEYACELLGSKRWPSQRIQALIDRFGVCYRTAQNYLRKARNKYIKASGKDRDQFRTEQISWLQEIVHDQTANLKNRLAAAKQLANLCGLNQPIRHEVTGKDGKPLIDRNLQQGLVDDADAAEAAATLDEVLLNGRPH